ncbi:MAG: carboxypeptidase regulatory-like domain-containing protein [Alphaproteobacteria bacterium]|nr:carboxypeptidase regulatory-like domain-containing protein [Alphaproteobacteria bacterium]
MTRIGWTLILVAACHKKETTPTSTDSAEPCDPVAQTGCTAGTVCEEVVGGEPECFAPVSIVGRVFDTSDDDPIAGARVVARDPNGAAVSGVVVSEVDGSFSLRIPAPRDAEGNPVGDVTYTLRADATAYLPFPKAPRSALPIDLSQATGDPPVIENAATDLGLIPLPDASGLGAVAGSVQTLLPGGTLVVAGGATGVADRDGSFVVFNVPAGSVEVRGYRAGVNLVPQTVGVDAGQTTEGVTLTGAGEASAVVSGTVQIVNAPGGSITSVILVVEDTFDPTVIRGEAPPGLRVGDVGGDWAIAGVPDGDYVVLAAYENDLLVRDPDTSIGGTQIVHVTVSGGDESVPGFKVTEALAVISPGADGAEAVTEAPTLTFEDDSSEQAYHVEVYDALGVRVWEVTGDFDPGGSKPVEVPYEGPLEPGMYYQFRATSLDRDQVPLSTTEDLLGVFFLEP